MGLAAVIVEVKLHVFRRYEPLHQNTAIFRNGRPVIQKEGIFIKITLLPFNAGMIIVHLLFQRHGSAPRADQGTHAL